MNVVLSLASGYKYLHLKPFIHSLLQTDFEGELVIFVNNIIESEKQKLANNRVQLIEYSPKFPYFESPLSNLVRDPGRFLSPNSLRYILYEAYLASRNDINVVLHSDIRDVVFQTNPFHNMDGKSHLEVFLEDSTETIASNRYNRFWIEHAYGYEVLDKIGGNTISCSGVTIGGIDAFKNYLTKMNDQIHQLENVGGLDQGIHNYLIRTNQLKNCKIFNDDEGRVSTISFFKPPQKIKIHKRQVQNMNGKLIPIIHQYDRHWKLLWYFNKRDFFGRKWNYFKQFLLAVWHSRAIKKKYLSNLKSILFEPMTKKWDWT